KMRPHVKREQSKQHRNRNRRSERGQQNTVERIVDLSPSHLCLQLFLRAIRPCSWYAERVTLAVRLVLLSGLLTIRARPSRHVKPVLRSNHRRPHSAVGSWRILRNCNGWSTPSESNGDAPQTSGSSSPGTPDVPFRSRARRSSSPCANMT